MRIGRDATASLPRVSFSLRAMLSLQILLGMKQGLYKESQHIHEKKKRG